MEMCDLNICFFFECYECIYYLVMFLWTIDIKVLRGKWFF